VLLVYKKKGVHQVTNPNFQLTSRWNWVKLCQTTTGYCKSWTLDSGLDHGLDYGLDSLLNFLLPWFASPLSAKAQFNSTLTN